MFLDATYCKARIDRRMVSQAVVIATRVAAGTQLVVSATQTAVPGPPATPPP